jgi:hypothetical protein
MHRTAALTFAPVGVLSGGGEASVGEAEEVLRLVVAKRGICVPALPPALHLQFVEEPRVPLPLLRLGTSFRPWRMFVHGGLSTRVGRGLQGSFASRDRVRLSSSKARRPCAGRSRIGGLWPQVSLPRILANEPRPVRSETRLPLTCPIMPVSAQASERSKYER